MKSRMKYNAAVQVRSREAAESPGTASSAADNGETRREMNAELKRDAAIGAFVRAHALVECAGGWLINEAFIAGAPSVERIEDVLMHSRIAAK